MLSRTALALGVLVAALTASCSSVAVTTPSEADPRLESTWAGPQRSMDPDPYRGVEYSYGRIAAEFGVREYRNANWDQLDSPSTFAVTGSREPPEWPLGADVGIVYARDSGRLGGTRLSSDTWEGFAGVMKSVALLRGRLILQAGGGGAVNYIEADPSDALLSRDDAFWTSLYGRLSATIQLSKEFEFGFAVRSARAGSFNLLDTSLDGDYDQIAFTLGASW